MMDRIFNLDNPFFSFMGKIADLMLLNILFIVCSIPIVTIGASWTALNYVCLKMKEQEEGYIIRKFFKSFKENFRQSTLMWLIYLALIIVLGLELVTFWNAEQTLFRISRMMVYIGIVMWILMFFMSFALQSRFYNTIMGTLRNSVLLIFANAPRVIAMLGILIGVLYLLTAFPNDYVRSYTLLYVILLGFAVQGFVNATMLQPVFKKLMPEEEAEERANDYAFSVDEEADLTNLGYGAAPVKGADGELQEMTSGAEDEPPEKDRTENG